MPRFHRIQIDGSLCTGAETFSCGLATTSVSGGQPAPSNLAEWANAIMASLNDSAGWAGNARSFISSAGQIRRVRIYSYPDLGQPADVQGVSTAAAITGTGTMNLPPQCSMVISLLTGRPGASYRGRMYWPLLTGLMTTAGKSSLPAQSVADNFAQWVGNIGSLSSGDAGEAAIASVSKGVVTPVTSVSIGDVVDTQRRRRDNLVENRFVREVT